MCPAIETEGRKDALNQNPRNESSDFKNGATIRKSLHRSLERIGTTQAMFAMVGALGAVALICHGVTNVQFGAFRAMPRSKTIYGSDIR